MPGVTPISLPINWKWQISTAFRRRKTRNLLSHIIQTRPNLIWSTLIVTSSRVYTKIARYIGNLFTQSLYFTVWIQDIFLVEPHAVNHALPTRNQSYDTICRQLLKSLGDRIRVNIFKVYPTTLHVPALFCLGKQAVFATGLHQYFYFYALSAVIAEALACSI